ncbi:zinc finger protein-like 1 homolog [Halyomorpha halys]|uniref:zinc finger protein-like 1 homolog n=1 Tax=Halyomorpha halys TaxID=286706 RepID=UPI0006D4EC31|nr:zinc finger protein-like 1 homolog [Halyomorpha halys]XP_024219799.1 zinc finger protein-like 1 homolog [Halyomorpha halys]
MGLCKCPKRKVTTQFCYEHRVNVCEYCVVLNHPRCVVQSYLLWLQDSDYSPHCIICKNELAIDECVRLCCYHVYHWDCLDQFVRELPDTTAPAGYKCLQCHETLLPNPVLASPVADALREKLSTVNWGRIGLGLPLAAEEEFKSFKRNVPKSLSSTNTLGIIDNSISLKNDVVVHIEETSAPRPEESAQIPRRNPQGVASERVPLLDEDENKYKRRDPVFGYGVNFWLKLFSFRSAYSRGVPCWKKLIFATFLFILFCLLLKVIAHYLNSDDPFFDVYAHPNVHIKE